MLEHIISQKHPILLAPYLGIYYENLSPESNSDTPITLSDLYTSDKTDLIHSAALVLGALILE